MSRKKRKKNRRGQKGRKGHKGNRDGAGPAKIASQSPGDPTGDDSGPRAEEPLDQRKAILGGCIVASGAGLIMILVMLVGGSLYIRSVEDRWKAEFLERGFTKRSGTALVVSETLTAKTLLLGGSVELHGQARDSVAIIARDATVTGHVHGTLFFRGGTLRLAPTAHIDGPLNLQASRLVTNGARFERVDGSVEQLIDDRAEDDAEGEDETDGKTKEE